MQNQHRNIAVHSTVAVVPLVVNYDSKLTNVLDIPFPANFLEQEAQDGTISYMTLGEFEIYGGYKFKRSKDGRYIAIFVQLSDLDNEYALFKGLLAKCGVTLAGKDFTQTDDDLGWLLTLDQYNNSFLPISPLFNFNNEMV